MKRKKWPAPPFDWKRMFHPLFGWVRVRPWQPGMRSTLIYPEQRVEWTKQVNGERDRVEINEPVHMPVLELRQNDACIGDDAMMRIALQVIRHSAR